jgi:hypothetical protein
MQHRLPVKSRSTRRCAVTPTLLRCLGRDLRLSRTAAISAASGARSMLDAHVFMEQHETDALVRQG